MIESVSEKINKVQQQFSVDDYVNCIIKNKGVFLGQVKWCSKLFSGEWKTHFLEITDRGSLIHSVGKKEMVQINATSSTTNLSIHEMDIALESFQQTPNHAIIKSLQGSVVRLVKSQDPVPIIHIETFSLESKDYYFKVFSTSKFKELLIVLTWWSSMKPAGLYNKLCLFKHNNTDSIFPTTGKDSTNSICQLNIFGPISSNRNIFVNNDINNNNKNNNNMSMTDNNNNNTALKSLPFFENHNERTYEWFPAIGVIDVHGRIKLLSQIDGSLIYSIDLTTLLQSEIICVDSSLTPDNFCIFLSENSQIRKRFKMNTHFRIYESNNRPHPSCKEILLSFPSKFDMTHWYMSMLSFVINERLSLSYMNNSNQLRLSNTLRICILEANLETIHLDALGDYGLHVEILANGKLIAKTAVVHSTNLPFWREEFTIQEIIPIYELKFRIVHNIYNSTSNIKTQVISEINMNQTILESKKFNTEVWVPIYDLKNTHFQIGSICLKIDTNLQIVLADSNFSKFKSLLLRCPIDQILELVIDKLKENISLMKPLSRVMLNIFQYYKKELEWFHNIINYEMNRNNYLTNSSSSLILRSTEQTYNSIFRGNSLFTISVEKYFNRIGEEYLFKSVGETIKDLINNNDKISFEIDPQRVLLNAKKEIDEQIKTNEENLLYWLDKLWNIIHTTSNDLPTEIKYIIKLIRQQLEMLCLDKNKLQEVTLYCVSSVLFLRFFCPIILNPQLFKLIHGNCSELMRRNLTILSKILLNFSSLTFFGAKEKWLTPMNDKFINKHKNELIDYIERVSEKKLDFTPKKFKFNYPKVINNKKDNYIDNSNSFDSWFFIDIHCNETELIKILNNNNNGSYSINRKEEIDNANHLTIGVLEFEDITKDNTEIFGDEFKSQLQINDNTKDNNDSNNFLISNTEEIKQEYLLLNHKLNNLITIFEKNEYPGHNISNNREYIERLCYSMYLKQSNKNGTRKNDDTIEIVIDMQGINKYEQSFFGRDNIFNYEKYCILDLSADNDDECPKFNAEQTVLDNNLLKDKLFVNNKSNKDTTLTRNKSKKKFSRITSLIVGKEPNNKRTIRNSIVGNNDNSGNGISRWFHTKK